MDERPPTDGEGDKDGGKVLIFPGNQRVTPSEIGAPYVVSQSGHVPTPDVVDPNAVAQDIRRRETYVKRQELTTAIAQRAPATEIVDILLLEIAEELAHLKFERRKATEDGKNTANYTISRIASLRQLSDILMKRQENARAERLDLSSPEFRKIMQLWMEYLYEAMLKVSIDESTIDTVFKQMAADMTDWEKKAGEAL